MNGRRTASEQSREQATDVLESWRQATVQILAAAHDPDFLDAWLALAKADLAGVAIEDRAAAASRLVAGRLAEDLFNPGFVERHRRARIAGEAGLPELDGTRGTDGAPDADRE